MNAPARHALVSLTFDDALDVHLDSAIPILDAAGLPGTFYVNLGAKCFGARRDEWQRAAAQGHELGNHTIFHPGVSSKAWVTEGIALENYSLDRMRLEIATANDLLRSIDGRTQRSFAFPCSNPWLGRPGWPRRILAEFGLDRTRLMGWIDRLGLDFGSRLQDYSVVVGEHFLAARCGGMLATQLESVPPDRLKIRGVTGDGAELGELIASVEAAIERNAWLVLVFHGIGGGHALSCRAEAFAGLVEFLSRDPRVKVLTFIEAAKQIWPKAQ